MPAADGNGTKKPAKKKRLPSPGSDAAQRKVPSQRHDSDAAQRKRGEKSPTNPSRSDAAQRSPGEKSPDVKPSKKRLEIEKRKAYIRRSANSTPLLQTAAEAYDNIGKSGAALALATYHDPIGVPTKTGKQLLRALPAMPGAVIDTVLHPEKTGTAALTAFGGRGDQSVKEKVKTIRKEGGLDYLSDVAAVTPAAGGAAVKLARLGRPSPAPRASKRISGDTTIKRDSADTIRDAVGRGFDKRRAKKHEKRLAEAEAKGTPVDALEFQAAQANRAAGRVVEVVARRAGTRQTKLVASQRGKAIYGFKRDEGRRTRAAAKHINRLNKAERRALYYAMAFGLRNGKHAEEILPALAQKIRDTRDRDAVQVTGSLKKSDMLPDIEKILADPDAHITPRLGEVIEALRADSIRAGREDPSLKDVRQRLGRRYAPLAEVLDLKRGEAADAPDGRVYYRGGNPGEKPKSTGFPEWDDSLFMSHDRDIAKLYGDTIEEIRLKPDAHVIEADTPAFEALRKRAGAGRLQSVKIAAQARKEGIDVVDFKRSEVGAIVLNPDAVRRASDTAPAHRYFDESDAAFIKRLVAKVDEMGLAKPLYFKSERYTGPMDFAIKTLGGKTAMAKDHQYEGVNLREGLQDTAPTQYLRGLSRNIKRKHNWNLVADILGQNSIKELSSPNGSTVSALRERMARAGIDMNGVALWNPGVYRTLAREDVDTTPDHNFAAGEEFEAATIASAMEHSTLRINKGGKLVDAKGVAVRDELLVKSSGWQVVPDRVLKELEAQMVPSGVLGRGWDIAKGKASRTMLLTGNVPWLGFQVASNAAMSTVATGARILNPKNWLDAHRWWHELDADDQARVGAMLGLDATSSDTAQVRLGASTNRDFVNAYRAFKAHPFWHTGVAKGRGPSVSQLNPLELMARADRGQNNAFRIAAGYTMAKRDAVHRMGEAMGRVDKAQLKLTSIMAKPPAEQLRLLARDQDVLDEHADAIVDWMGDYTTLTAAERKAIGRTVMFMPYLRYSLRLLFYTMPVKHPVMTALLAELSNLKADEYAKLFGEAALPWNSGKVRFGAHGDIQSIDLKRANPILNAPIEAASHGAIAQYIGVAPPWFGWIADQAYQKAGFTGKDWAVEGSARQMGGPKLPILSWTRARIALDDVAGITFPYRLGEKLTQSGPQGDDSILGSPRPTVYKGDDADDKARRTIYNRREKREEAEEDWIHELIPLLPRPDHAAEEKHEDDVLARIDEPAPKPRAKRTYGTSRTAKSYGTSRAGGRSYGVSR